MASSAPAKPSPIRIDVRSLSFSPGLVTILHGVSFSLRPGECLGILGPSGAGKSTLLKLVNGFERDVSGGQVLYQGEDFHTGYERWKSSVGYVPQDDIVHMALSAEQELWYAGLLRMPAADEDRVERRVREVLRTLEIHEVAHLRNHRLSGGQRKRVSIGVELMTSPPVLFLDEPTSGLDPALEEKMMRLFQRLAKQGRTVLLTTHVMETLDVLDLVLVLVKGRLAFYGSPREALRYFGVSRFAEVYPKLETRSPDDWKRAFAAHELHERWVTRRLAEPVEEATPVTGRPSAAPAREEASPGGATGGAEAPASRPTEASAPTDAVRSPGGDDDEPSLDEELEALRREVQG